jgi:hypothetical protein
MRDLANDISVVRSSEPDVVPRVGVSVDFPHYLSHRVRAFGRVELTVCVSLVLLCAGAVSGLAWRRSAADGRTPPAGAGVPVRTRAGVR